MMDRLLHKIKLLWNYHGPYTSHFGITKILWLIKFYKFRNSWSLYVFGINSSYFNNSQQGWIRIFGYGISWKDITKVPLLFSERNGYKKRVIIGKYSFKWLPKFRVTTVGDFEKEYNKA